MKNIYRSILLLTIIFFANASEAQIKNQFVQPEQSYKQGVRLSKVKDLPEYELPNINVNNLLEEDSLGRLQGNPFRFGTAVNVDIDFMKSATKSSNQDTTLYFYKILSKNAFSINLIFDRFILAKSANLLIYNLDKTMVYGPITSDNNPVNGIFWTDLIKGESIIIQLAIIGKDTKETKIHISKIIHGYQDTFAGFGQAALCTRDIACPEGNNWRLEGNSVAMILLADGTRWCSGALLNNACQNFTPNFLTAFHCLDSDTNGTLSNDEQNAVHNWVFRFLYDSPTCGGREPRIFLSINGSTLRSAFQPSDFSLLLLNTTPTGNVTYAGWTRTNLPATSSVGIHHPNGDVKKISIANNQAVSNQAVINWSDGTASPINTHWTVVFGIQVGSLMVGGLQGGSSGSPLFNQDHRIVGQLHGGIGICPGDANFQSDYGRFDVSWNGGGTPNTQLSIWLTDDPNVTQVNTISLPIINASDYVCSSGNQITITNVPVGLNVNWSASPCGFFTSCAGTGASPVLYAANGQIGQGTITFSTLGCGNNATFSRNFWVGTPQADNTTLIYPTGGRAVDPVTLLPNTVYQFNSDFVPGASSFTWMLPSGFSFVSGQGTSNPGIRTSATYGNYTLYCTADNACGSNWTHSLGIIIDGSCIVCPRIAQDDKPPAAETFAKIALYPNPVSTELKIRLTAPAEQEGELSLIDLSGNIKRQGIIQKGTQWITLGTSDLFPGMYVIKINDGSKEYYRKVLVQH